MEKGLPICSTLLIGDCPLEVCGVVTIGVDHGRLYDPIR